MRLLCLLIAAAALFVGAGASAQSEAHSEALPPPYKQLRYDEDYRYLRDATRSSDILDAVKFMPFALVGDDYLTIGGEVRERYEYFHNSQWGAGPQDSDGYLLQRYMLHGDLHLGEQFRLFGQLKSGIESGRTGGPRPTDEDVVDVHQLFLDESPDIGGGFSLTIRVGRQELQYGTSRIISAREGPNVRQSFDGVKLIATLGDWRVDSFVTRPVETNRGAFDDGSDRDRAFWGIYATRPLAPLPDGHVDLYYLGLDRRGAEFDQGTEHEERHSTGARLFGAPRPWDYNFEAVWQFGKFGDGRIEAWTVASDTGLTLSMPLEPRLGLKADIASGDRDPNSEPLQTFNPLFPRGAYFSETALIGPVNIIDLHPSVEIKPADGARLYVDWDFFWRQSLSDGLYGVAVNPVRPGSASNKRYIGSQAQVGCEWTLWRHFTLTLVYAHFFAGPFIEDTGPGEDVDYVSTWFTFKF